VSDSELALYGVVGPWHRPAQQSCAMRRPPRHPLESL